MRARAHTGRSRNDAARDAILTAAADLLAAQDVATITMAEIARRAGAGKQTIYRWWPSKGAVLLEAMVWLAQEDVSFAVSGDLRRDLETFVRATFDTATRHRSLLLGVLREALGDRGTAAQLEAFAAQRRTALCEILSGAGGGAALDRKTSAMVVDQVFGVLWYRLVFANAPLDNAAARQLVDGVVAQLTRREATGPARG